MHGRKTGTGIFRHVRETCKVESDIRGCDASAFAINVAEADGAFGLEATAVFLFRNERTAESQATKMGKFYREAQDSSPSWSPPFNLPVSDITIKYSIDMGEPGVDNEFAIFQITYTFDEEASRDDGRERATRSTDRADTPTPVSISPVRKVTPSVAVPSKPDVVPAQVVSVPSTPDVTRVKRGSVPSERDVISVDFSSPQSTPFLIPVHVGSVRSTPDTSDMSSLVPAELMGDHVGEWVTVKGKLDANRLGSDIRAESGKSIGFHSSTDLACLSGMNTLILFLMSSRISCSAAKGQFV